MKNQKGFVTLPVLTLVLVILGLLSVGVFGSLRTWSQPAAQEQSGSDIFTAGPTTGSAPLNVSFAVTKYISKATLVRFGDGTEAPVSDFRCGLQFCSQNHVYTKPGTFNATYFDADGRALKYFVITVVSTEPPPSGMTATPTAGPAPLMVTFSNIESAPSDEEIHFGDGKTAATGPTGNWAPEDLVHTYTTPGVYVAKLYRSLPSIVLGTVTITVTGSGQSSSVSVPGMSKYTDSDFGFSFWYPSSWKVTTTDSWVSTRGGVVVKTLGVGETYPEIKITEFDSTSLTVTDTGGAGPFGSVKYFFDPTKHAWMVTWPEGAPSGASGATTTADVSLNTMGGLHVLPGTSRFDTNIVPLSAEDFVIVSDGGGANAKFLAQTVVATDPSVAMPVSVAEQIKTIQAEKDAYAQ